MKRLLALLLCSVLLLTGCFEEASTDVETTTQPVESTEQTDEKIYAVKDGAAVFTIVYGQTENATHADYVANTLKAKTGIQFKVTTDPARAQTSHIIYVGLHSSVTSIYELYGDSISYNGYGVVQKDGDIYLCGYNETMVGKAAKRFLSEMTTDHVIKGESGCTSAAYFVPAMFFLKNPTYEVEAPMLLGAPMEDYTVVIGAKPDLVVKDLTKICIDQIGTRTGAYLRMEQTSGSLKQIVLTYDKTMELFDYSICSEGRKINVCFGGVSALYGAFEALTELCMEGTASEISLTENALNTVLKDLPRKNDTDIRVTSANVLGTGLEKDNQCATAVRAAIMGEYIMALQPDSIGLQEYYGSYTAGFMSLISPKYELVRFAGFGSPIVATAYLKDKYTVKESRAINIKVEETFGDPLAQNYYFTWVVLEDEAGEQYVHANLHLEYRNDTLRLRQCEMINSELTNVLTKYPDAALVITGDYNSKISSNSPIFDAIRGELALECAELIAPEDRRDDDISSFHTLCSFTSILTNSPSAIDHVMVNTNTTSVQLHKIIYDALICHASDHCPVVVDFARKNV